MPHPDEQSIPALIGQLGDDVCERVSAEVALRKAEVASRVAASKPGLAMLGAASMLVIAALVALAVGLLLIASLWIGIIWATIAVVLLFLVIAGMLAKLGATSLSRAAAGPESEP